MSKICGFVLAAGEGRRIRPATLVHPKALLPFCGVPLLNLALSELLAVPEVTQVVVNASYLGEQVEEACRNFSRAHGIEVNCSVEEHLLNHGGGIRKGVKRFVTDADTIFVHNVDVVHDYDLWDILKFHLAHEADVTALLIPNNRKIGVSVDDANRITSFHSPEGHLTFSGLYLLKKEILDFLPAEEEAPSILTAFHRAAAAGKRVLGMVGEVDRYWSDVGTPREYIRAHGEITDCGLPGQQMLREAVLEQGRRRFALEQKGVRCTGALGLGDNLQIPQGSHLHNVVVWDGTVLETPGIYADGIIGGGRIPAPLPPNDVNRQPDERVFKALDLVRPEGKYEEPVKQGSGRRYVRLEDPVKGGSVIWSAYSLARRENSVFAEETVFLKRLGIPVADVRLHLPEKGELVLEDLGGKDLLQASPEERWALLPQVLAQAAHLHHVGAQAARLDEVPLQAPFTLGYYNWERDYFRKNFLANVLGRTDMWDDRTARECCMIRAALLDEPQVLLHRDFQSANIKVRDGKCYWIDYQGMRLGAAVYDLASLLYDPYVEYTPEQRCAAWRQYCEFVFQEGGRISPEGRFHAAAIQRLMQALGAYGTLWKLMGMEWYRPFITPALKHLRQAALAVGNFPGFVHLAENALELWEKA